MYRRLSPKFVTTDMVVTVDFEVNFGRIKSEEQVLYNTILRRMQSYIISLYDHVIETLSGVPKSVRDNRLGLRHFRIHLIM